MNRMRVGVLALVAVVMVGCSTMGDKKMEASLYDRLGGKDSIAAVVEAFVSRFEGDERVQNKAVANRLAQIDRVRLKGLLVDLICQGAGGPCEYTGRSMEAAHAGLRITDAEFDIAVEDLITTLDEFDVQDPERQELLDMLGPMRGEVVQG